jgi:hypothetical protein
VAEEVEEAEKLLSRQTMHRLRESLAFRSLEPCSSCVLEVPDGVLGVLASAADLVLLQQRSRGKLVEKVEESVYWTVEEEGSGGVEKSEVDWWMGWSGCGWIADAWSEPGPLLL